MCWRKKIDRCKSKVRSSSTKLTSQAKVPHIHMISNPMVIEISSASLSRPRVESHKSVPHLRITWPRNLNFCRKKGTSAEITCWRKRHNWSRSWTESQSSWSHTSPIWSPTVPSKLRHAWSCRSRSPTSISENSSKLKIILTYKIKKTNNQEKVFIVEVMTKSHRRTRYRLWRMQMGIRLVETCDVLWSRPRIRIQ